MWALRIPPNALMGAREYYYEEFRRKVSRFGVENRRALVRQDDIRICICIANFFTVFIQKVELPSSLDDGRVHRGRLVPILFCYDDRQGNLLLQ